MHLIVVKVEPVLRTSALIHLRTDRSGNAVLINGKRSSKSISWFIHFLIDHLYYYVIRAKPDCSCSRPAETGPSVSYRMAGNKWMPAPLAIDVCEINMIKTTSLTEEGAPGASFNSKLTPRLFTATLPTIEI